MNFVAIDFETANYYRDSACQIGLTFVEDGDIVDYDGSLINPDIFFDHFNTRLHGIDENTVADSPFFEKIWEKYLPLLQGKVLVAHNAIFDFGVLRASLEQRGLAFPESKTYCTYQMAKKVLPNLPSYSLGYLCDMFDIPLDHHDALSDSRACAELFLLLADKAGVTSVDHMFEKLAIYHGLVSSSEFKNPRKKREYTGRAASTLTRSENSEDNPDSAFFQKTVAITGTLSSMQRKEAHQKIIDLGGDASDRISKKVDFLIVGQTDFRQVGDKGASRKQLQAEAMHASGHQIEIVSEEFFLENI